jgi:hypothetical protein
MFRLIRLVVLLLAAFVAGMLYERGHLKQACETLGGVWIQPGYCDKAG